MPFGIFKRAFSGISTQVWLLSLAMLINRSGTMVILFMTVYATATLHFSVEQAGTIMALFGAGSLVGVFLSGKITDRIGYYKVMIGSLFMGGVLFMVLSQVTSFYMLALGTFLVSLFGEAFRPANMAAIAFYSKPENFTRALSLNRLAINLGFSIGPALGGLLAQYSFETLFIVDGLSCIAASLVVLFFVPAKGNHTPADAIESAPSNNISPFKDKPFLVFAFLGVLYATAFFQMFSTMPLYYKQIHLLSEPQIGLLMAFNGLGVAIIEMILIYKLENKLQPLHFAALGGFMLMLNYILLPFASSLIWLYVSMLMVTLSEMFAMPFMTTFMMKRAGAKRKGSYSAVYSMTWSVAQIISPLIATQTIAHYGFNWLWVILACFGLAVTFGMIYLHKYLAKGPS